MPEGVTEVTIALAFGYPKSAKEYFEVDDVGLFAGDLKEWPGTSKRDWPDQVAPTHWLDENFSLKSKPWAKWVLILCNVVLIVVVWLNHKLNKKTKLAPVETN